MDGFTHITPLPLEAIAARAGAVDRDGAFPFESLALLRQTGALRLTVPAEFGGRGAGLAQSVALIRSVGQACASTALVLAMQLIHVSQAAHNPAWPRALRYRVLNAVVEDGALLNALQVEPELGSPSRGGVPATVAARAPGGWHVTGRKIYSTGAPGLRWGQVYLRTDEPEPRVGKMLVALDSPGVSIVPTWDQMGLRGSGSHDVLFDAVFVPDADVVDLRPPAGWSVPDLVYAAWTGLCVAGLYSGVAEAARDWLLGFLNGRVPANLGAPLASLPRMQEAVGAIEAKLLVNRRLVDGAAASFDRGGLPPGEAALIKTVACANAIAAVQDAVALAGNHALSRANPIERHLRDALCARIHSPQPDAVFTAAGRASLARAQQE